MGDTTSKLDALNSGYQTVYESLGELREAFHRSGRLDDSNAKLDEVAKLFATYLAFKRGLISKFPDAACPTFVGDLQDAFREAAALSCYRMSDGASIFGSNPTLALRTGDETFGADLAKLVKKSIDLAFDLRSAGKPFDVLNEAFGHFVRDNFRGNIEDAQYMTPPEVVDFMADMALFDIRRELTADEAANKHWTVLDPTCGVGSFLAAIYTRARHSDWLDPSRLRIFGQDKVERMVRLATLNLELFAVEEHRISIGNSLAVGSPIDELNGQVDLILTNPPFGARFAQEEAVFEFASNTPFFSRLRRQGSALDSELLFVDRNLRLLREGGRLLIVIPDGVISAKGLAAMLRQHVASVATIRAIVELPPVTFAQAGTRTKTAILYLRKNAAAKTKRGHVFMGVSRDLGFVVSSRKGVQVKVTSGENDLPAMLTHFRESTCLKSVAEAMVLSEKPSAVLATESGVAAGSWTPNHYNAVRFKSVEMLRSHRGFQLLPLGELAEFLCDARPAEKHQQGNAFISVLHVLGEGLLDARGVMDYCPKTPGVGVEPGEVLLSRINPRIPRVCVVPDFGVRTLCSSEFEVMRPKPPLDAFTLAFLLQSKVVQDQIKSLTSGTSASHNRIRTSELAEVRIPIPRDNTAESKILRRVTTNYSEALQLVLRNTLTLGRLRGEEEKLFATGNL